MLGYPFPEWVPKEVVEGYSQKGLEQLFEWQVSALSCKNANFVFSAPTSAGKSLVAELLGLNKLLSGKKVLYIVPYVAVAKEKFSFLQKLWRRIDIQVAGFIGPNSASSREWNAAVCTMEKANSLIGHAIIDGSLKEYGMAIIDELHMIYDNSRGPTLESLLAKLNFYNAENSENRIAIVGMSATLPNLEKIGHWLNAEIFETDFRPVELKQCYSYDGNLYKLSTREVIHRLDKKFRYPGDFDSTIGFAVESILRRKSTLVFCSSKNDVEKTAIDIAKIMDVELKLVENAELLSQEKLWSLKELLEQSCSQLDPVLAKTLPRGVAFHHAGLISEERECVEKAFREGTIYCLVATSTLSSGVNLPAFRVIIKAQIRGPASLNSTTFCQMAGRAGRMGFSEQGECIVTSKSSEVETVLKIIKSPIHVGNDMRDASKVVLESVCSGLTPSFSAVTALTSQLLHRPKHSPEHTVAELASQSLISRSENDENMEIEDVSLTATQLGRAALASSLPPEAALFVFADLKNATKAMAIDTELHMMYLVTPINCSVWQGCDWNHLFTIFTKMDSNQKRVAKMIGANERFLLERLQSKYIESDNREYQLHLRFFSALALFDIVSEVPLIDVSTKFRICRGSLQALQQQSATYAAMVVAFCNRLGWQYLRSLLDGFASRLAFGVRAELTELIRIEGIDGSRARIFHDHGITSLAQLAQFSVSDVSNVLSMAVPFERSNDDAIKQEWLFGEEKLSLVEAANTIISRAREAVSEIMRKFGIEANLLDGQSQSKKTIDQSRSQSFVNKSQTQSRVPRRSSILPSKSQTGNSQADAKPTITESLLTSTPNNITNFSPSTIESRRRKRISIPYSQISNDSAFDIFSDSMIDLSLSDSIEDLANTPTSIGTAVEEDNEIDDLECSLLKIRGDPNVVEDSFDQTLELIGRGNTQRPKKIQNGEDSFDIPLSQILLPKTQVVPNKLKERRSTSTLSEIAENSIVNDSVESVDIFDSPVVAHKRSRNSVLYSSPTIASPLCKTRRAFSSSAPTFFIDDVCRSESTWNVFVSRSSYWLEISMDVLIDKGSVSAISFCAENENPVFIPLNDEEYIGNSMEEDSYPSGTACQNITLYRRIAHIKRICESCTVYSYNSLFLCSFLQEKLSITIFKPVCVQYLAFLAHYRNGEAPLSITQLASRFNWSFNLHQHLKMNHRIRTAIQSYICSKIHNDLQKHAVSLSSEKAIELEILSVQVVAHISRVGFPFSSELCKRIADSIRDQMNVKEEKCYEYAGRVFNLESASAVSEILFCKFKIPHPGGMNAGKRHLSANKTVLAQIEAHHPIVQLILQFRQLKHSISQCLKPLQEYVTADNVIRTSFEICTATGRILSKEPNVQNVPKGVITDGLSVRSIFASRPGRIFVAADYCQLELRVLAHLSADPQLLKQLSLEAPDIFSELAKEWGFPRDSVKQLCYGLIYGMGVKSLADSTKLSVIEAQRLVDSFFSSFPKVKSYISTTKEQGDVVGFVNTFLGRRRIVCSKGRQEEKAREYRQSVNFTIQGTASEIFKAAIVGIHRRLKGLDADIVMIVHDEVIIDCEENILSSISEILHQEMENVFVKLQVPLKVKISTGKCWGSLNFMTIFRIRNFLCDYSILPATEFSAKNGSTERSDFPVIHMFGPTEAGVKACVHIHGVLPYMVLRVGGELTERVQELISQKLNKLLHGELNRKKGPEQLKNSTRIPQYVHHLEGFLSRSIYGYQSHMETFVKVFFTNPFYVVKLTSVLGQLANENPIMQPFEAHVPFILQFFIDQSIFGMDWVQFRSVKYRLSPDMAAGETLYNRITVKKIRSNPDMLSPISPATSCFIEVDVTIDNVLNVELHSCNVHSSNPGLEYIWAEEAERCRLQQRTLNDVFNQYTPRPYPIIKTEKEFVEKLKKVVTKLQESSLTDTARAILPDGESNNTTPVSKNAEAIWSQALQADVTERIWSDTQDIDNFGLEEDWNFQEVHGEEEEDNVYEMTMLVEEAGVQQLTETEQTLEERVTPVLETTVFENRRDVVSPFLPQEQLEGLWYRSRKKPPLVKRVRTVEVTPQTAPAHLRSNVEVPAVMKNKMFFVDETVGSSGAPRSPTPDVVTDTDGRIDEIRHICAASLELFIYTEHRMPNPLTDGIMAAALCITLDACRASEAAYHVIITTIPSQTQAEGDLVQAKDESDLVEQIISLVTKYDPDVLIGYDADRLSWSYLLRRAEFLTIANFSQRLGRFRCSRNPWQKNSRITSNIDGRLMESVWRCVRRDLNLRSYDRATASMQILNSRVPALDDYSLSRRYIEMTSNAGRPVYRYLRRLSSLNILILNSMDWFVKNTEMARVYGIQFHEVWTRGSQLRVESMLLRLAHKLQYVAPSVTVEQRDKMCAPEQLQLIMEPESKVYHDPVIVLDFQSLYPSMIIAYNYCFSSLLGKISNLIVAAELGASSIEVGAVKYAFEKLSLIEAVMDNKVHSSPLATAFVQSSYREGVMVTLLKEVLGARIMIKTSMKNTRCRRLLRILDARQLALKLVANVTYGYTAANWSGRMPCVEVADAILAKGRETLERAIAMVNTGEYGGARVIYGDTDSLFVLVKGASLKDAFAIGRRIAQDVTAANPAPVVLKLEKVYSGCVLETKKRYAGWMYEGETSTPKLDAKGIETVLEKSLEFILQRKYDKFLSFLDNRLSSLKQAPFSDFVFCKEYRGDYEENSPVPQKKVAEYYQLISPGYQPLRGERLPYLVVVGTPDSTVFSCVKSVDEFLDDEDLKINASYYVRAHILAALHRVTALIPLNIDYLDEISFDCFNRDCLATGGRPWCRSCAAPVETFLDSTLRLAKEQRILEKMKKICNECQETIHVDIEACANYSCSTNKMISMIRRSDAPLAFLLHRRFKPLICGEDGGSSICSGSNAGSQRRPLSRESIAGRSTDQRTDYFDIVEDEQMDDNELEKEEEEEEEEEEEYHDKTVSHFTNINDDDDVQW